VLSPKAFNRYLAAPECPGHNRDPPDAETKLRFRLSRGPMLSQPIVDVKSGGDILQYQSQVRIT
jgi:hypothetical protein